jgi:hypothetical protein
METQDTCKNCEATLAGPFCGQCGQAVISERITVRNLFAYVFAAITNVERGLWFTLNALLRRPAKVIQEYVNGRTRPYYHPLRLAFLVGTVSVILMFALVDFEATQAAFSDVINPNVSESQRQMQEEFNQKIKPFFNFLPLLMLPFYAVFSRRFFRKKQLNYAEHMVMHAYMYSIVTAISLPLIFLYAYFDMIILSPIVGFVLYGIFSGIVYKRLFSGSLGLNIFKGIMTFIFGYILFMLMVGVLALIIIVPYVIITKSMGG